MTISKLGVLVAGFAVLITFSQSAALSARQVYAMRRARLQQQNVNTCTSAGYSNGCCVPGNTICFVSEGNCYCDITCHNFGDCCEDIDEIGCSLSTPTPAITTTEPTSTITPATSTQSPSTRPPSIEGTCTSAGYTAGCCDDGTNCLVPSGKCYCDARCHENRDCCSDIEEVGCVASTCRGASLSPGYCNWTVGQTECYVPGGQCYCDLLCYSYGDCCSDAYLADYLNNDWKSAKKQDNGYRVKRTHADNHKDHV